MASKDTDQAMSCATECSPKYKSVMFSGHTSTAAPARGPSRSMSGRLQQVSSTEKQLVQLSRPRGSRTNVRASLATDAKKQTNRANQKKCKANPYSRPY